MDISTYKVEDFVLDPEFRKWVLSANQESNIFWQDVLEKNPKQYMEMEIAREIVLNLSGLDWKLDESESQSLWESIDRQTPDDFFDEPKGVLVPLNSWVTFRSTPKGNTQRKKYPQISRVAAILVCVFTIAVITEFISGSKAPQIVEEAFIEYEEFLTPRGVKSTLTLNDGSRIILNSGSAIGYVKNFDKDKRIVHLNGEAYFEVAKDPTRPFSVVTGDIITTALGTSFNVTSYKDEPTSISLLSGKISIDFGKELSENKQIILEENKDNSIKIMGDKVSKEKSDVEKSIAWTQKTIVFEKTKLEEAIRVLENWYGVDFIFHNKANKSLTLTGKFQDETLENVLEGLSYSARFDFEIKKDKVEIRFK